MCNKICWFLSVFLLIINGYSGCTFDSAGLPENQITEPSCSDRIQNADETDIDCGGPNCNPCSNGKNCLENSDCSSQICSDDKICIPQATCSDGVQNANETDIDCGGIECDPCGVDLHCEEHRDCASGFCNAVDLCAEPSCEDGERNGNETDIDCGGSECSPCTLGRSCVQASDCISGVCVEFVCQAPSCTDHVHNGNETDVDCGGVECAPCANGASCVSHSDCYSLVCNNSTCQAPSCNDLTWNQYETDIDCGGPNCPPCALNKRCINNDDCTSHFCNNNLCTAITSCKHLVSLFPNSPSGMYYITPEETTVEAFCYIVPPDVYTLYYVRNGPSTSKKDDNDGCKDIGMMLFTPLSSSHYTIARDRALLWNIPTQGPFLGPLGIYNPNNGNNDISTEQWCGWIAKNCCKKKMIGGGQDDTVSRSGCGFTSLAGNIFWASEKTDIDEPNGDYTATCWLLFNYNSSGDVDSWNDNKCSYSYSSYMCMARDDVPTTP